MLYKLWNILLKGIFILQWITCMANPRGVIANSNVRMIQRIGINFSMRYKGSGRLQKPHFVSYHVQAVSKVFSKIRPDSNALYRKVPMVRYWWPMITSRRGTPSFTLIFLIISLYILNMLTCSRTWGMQYYGIQSIAREISSSFVGNTLYPMKEHWFRHSSYNRATLPTAGPSTPSSLAERISPKLKQWERIGEDQSCCPSKTNMSMPHTLGNNSYKESSNKPYVSFW